MSQIGTHWQVALATDPTFAAPVKDVTTYDVNQLTVYSPLGLTESTAYLMRAALIDSISGEGGFGPATPFTTLVANVEPEPPPVTEWEPVC